MGRSVYQILPTSKVSKSKHQPKSENKPENSDVHELAHLELVETYPAANADSEEIYANFLQIQEHRASIASN